MGDQLIWNLFPTPFKALYQGIKVKQITILCGWNDIVIHELPTQRYNSRRSTAQGQ